MKITKELIRLFEADQKAYNTETAIFNLLWLQAREQLADIGVKGLKTTLHKNTLRRGKL
jgi:hypothetical protein